MCSTQCMSSPQSVSRTMSSSQSRYLDLEKKNLNFGFLKKKSEKKIPSRTMTSYQIPVLESIHIHVHIHTHIHIHIHIHIQSSPQSWSSNLHVYYMNTYDI